MEAGRGGRIGGMGAGARVGVGAHSDVTIGLFLQENTQPPFSPRLKRVWCVRFLSV